MKTLYVHIGTGKTGSTAIQKHLAAQKSQFEEGGIHYWGLNFELSACNQVYPWQRPSGISLLQRMAASQARTELSHVLEESLLSLSKGDVAIWSNESIYERPDVYIPLLHHAVSNGLCSIRLIAYVRGMKSYLLSAYKQWGVKHKTYSGKVLGFSEWTEAKQDFLAYGRKLFEWDLVFGNALSLFNYESVGDVLGHFVGLLPNSDSLLPMDTNMTDNSTPDDIQLALHALYNSQFSEPVLPHTITNLLRRYNLNKRPLDPPSLSSLYPSSSEIDRALLRFQEDTRLVNKMLVGKGQPPLTVQDVTLAKAPPRDSDLTTGLLAVLINIITQQESRISQLEDLLKKQ